MTNSFHKIKNLNSKDNFILFSCYLTLKFIFLFFNVFFSSINVTADTLENKIIALTQIIEHPSLEQAKAGIIDILKENGLEEGKNLKIIKQNAQGNIANAALIAKNFVTANPDAIITISTPSTQAMLKAAKNSQIPIIFCSVTDPESAGLIKNIFEADPYLTGAMDFPPIKEELDLIRHLIPNIKKLGLLYNSGESNSVKIIELLKNENKNQIIFIEAVAHNSSQITQAFNSLVGKVDAIYVPSDNTIFAAIPKLVQLSHKNKLPIFSNDPDSVKHGFLACVGYSQYEVGRTAGKLVIRTLKGEKFIKMERPEKVEIYINLTTAENLNISLPEIFLETSVNIVK